MKTPKTILCTVISLLFAFSKSASALTMSEFFEICGSKQKCSTNPMLQAYVGGALDLVAMLDEETDYLKKIYCKNPESILNVPKIIQFMEMNQDGYAQKNAMLLVIRYLEENGGC